MNRLLTFLYKINNRFSRRIIEKIILRLENGYAFSSTLRELYAKYYGLHIGYGTYGGCFTHVNIPQLCEVHFGNYCSIGSNLKIFRANHPSDSFTTHPFLYNPVFQYVKQDHLNRPALRIGHDVWIGSSVIICPGCMHIGDGAIVGAGSVVVHDVPPYTIVAGCPAKVIRRRFNDEQIQFLKESGWWKFDFATLKKNTTGIEKHLKSLEDK